MSLTPVGARFLLGSVVGFTAAAGTMLGLAIGSMFGVNIVALLGVCAGTSVGAMIGAASIQYVRRRPENFSRTVAAAGASGLLLPFPVFRLLPGQIAFVALWALVGGLTVYAEYRSAKRLKLDD